MTPIEEYLKSDEAKQREKTEPPYIPPSAQADAQSSGTVARCAAATGSVLSETPETDAEAAILKVPVQSGANGVAFMKAECVPSWLPRKLEIERDEALAALKRIISTTSIEDAHWIANTSVDAATPINFPDPPNNVSQKSDG